MGKCYQQHFDALGMSEGQDGSPATLGFFFFYIAVSLAEESMKGRGPGTSMGRAMGLGFLSFCSTYPVL